jgi:hypothetical protein
MYPDHEWVLRTTTTFSEAGNLLEQRHANPDGSEWQVVCRYDERGRLVERDHQVPEGRQVFSYHYDALGRLERVVERSPAGAERVSESYAYDQAGRKTATVYPDPALRERVHHATAAEFEFSFEASSIMTIFDERGRPVKRVFYDPNGMVDRRIAMRYDAAGRLVEEGEREADGGIRADRRHVNRHDAEGRVIETATDHYSRGADRVTFAYNEHGDVAEERHDQTAGPAGLDRDQHWTVSYRYRYDDRGNWVERMAETSLEGGEPVVSTVERRRLDYY